MTLTMTSIPQTQPPDNTHVMSSSTTIPYENMSKADLIDVAYRQQSLIQRFYKTLAIPNNKASLGEKVAWLIAKPLLADQTPNEQGLVRAPINDIAEAMGMSESSVSRYIAQPCERLNLTHESVPYTTKAGQKCNLTYINPAEPYWIDLETAPAEVERTINGNGKCRCGGTIHKQRRVIADQEIHECDRCGEKTVFPVKERHAALPEGFYPGIEGPQAGDLLGKLENMQSSTNPSTPPLQMSELSLDPEKESALLLLEVAGDHTEHIEMIPDPQKYTTVARPLTVADLRTHLRGGKPKGTRLYRSDGKARAFCFDADTPEDWQRKIEAARLLDIVGFKPILEAAPAQGIKHAGGGKLWIPFSELVDRYSALQTIYQYTGSLLKHSAEYWPKETDTGNRVRLPGGKYIHPDFKAWCKLFTADGEELSHDGTGAAQVLLDYQTPADVVNAYEKPAADPEPEIQRPASPTGGVLGKDLAKQFIADFNAQRSWSDIAAMVGGFNRNGKFLAEWRGDRKPDVGIWQRTDLAKDFARPDEPAMDKYDVWCKIMAHRLGQDWQLFKKQDLAQRCEYRRHEQERRAS